MKKVYIYNAGPLFTEYEQRQKKYEGKVMREYFAANPEIEAFVGNPIDLSINASATSATNVDGPTPSIHSSAIFKMDNEHIQKANVFFIDLANNDPGTLVELGMATQKKINVEEVEIFAINSDFRINDAIEIEFERSIGHNKFVIGALTTFDFKLYKSFDEAFEAFKIWVKN